MAANPARVGRRRWCGVPMVWLAMSCALPFVRQARSPRVGAAVRVPPRCSLLPRGARVVGGAVPAGGTGPPAPRRWVRSGQRRPLRASRRYAARRRCRTAAGRRRVGRWPAAAPVGGQRHRGVGQVDHAGEAVAAAEGEHAVRGRQPGQRRRRRAPDSARRAGSPPGTAPASRPGRRSAPGPSGPSSRPAAGSQGAAAPSGLNPNGGSSPAQGSGTRQPSRPGSTRAGAFPHRVLAHRVRDVLDLARARAPRPGRRRRRRAATARAARRRGPGGCPAPGRSGMPSRLAAKLNVVSARP